MPKFVVSYRGEGTKPEEDVAKLRAAPSVTVLDESLPRMVLVDGPEDALRDLLDGGWSISPEKTYALPAPHPAAKRLRTTTRTGRK